MRAGRRVRAAALLALALLLLGSLAAPAGASAETRTWDGPAAGSWQDAANWSGDVVPSSLDEVVIGDGVTVTVPSGTIDPVALTIGSGSKVTLDSGATITSTPSLIVAGVGTIELADGAGVSSWTAITVSAGATWVQHGAISIGTSMAVFGSATLANGAGINVASGSPSFTFNGAALTLGAGAYFNVPVQLAGGTVQVGAGTVTLDKGATVADGVALDVDTGAVLDVSGAQLAISGNVIVGGGSLTVSGAGTLRLVSGAHLHLGEGNVTIPAAEANATITGSGTISDGVVQLCGGKPITGTHATPTALTFTADVTVDLCTNTAAAVVVYSELDVYGELLVGPRLLYGTGAQLTLHDDAELRTTSGTARVGVATTVARDASVRVASGTTLELNPLLLTNIDDGALTNGRWQVASGGSINLPGLDPQIDAVHDATLTLADSGNVTFNGSRYTAFGAGIELSGEAALVLDEPVLFTKDVTVTDDAKLSGTGLITGNVTMTGGTIQPGAGSDMSGELKVYGNVTMSGGTLDIAVVPEAKLDANGGSFTLTVTPPTQLVMRTHNDIPTNLQDAPLIDGWTVAPGSAFASQQVVQPPEHDDGEWTLQAAFSGASLLANRLDVKAPEPPTVLTSPTHGADPVTDRRIEIDFDGASDTGIGLAGYVVRWGAAAPEQPGDGTITHPHDVDADAGQSWELPDLGTGAWYVAVWAVDAHGNVSAEPAIAGPFAIDVTPPPVPSVGNAPGVTTARTAALVFSSAESGVRYECSLNGAAFAACTSPATLSGLGLGSHAFRVRAIDALGNASAPGSIGWTVVAPPPPPPPPPPPTTTPPPPPPPVTPPKLPAKKAITLTGQSRLSQAKRRGQLWLRFPVTAKGVRSRVQITVSARDARRLGIKVPRRAKTVTIGTVTVTSKRRGNVTAKVKFTKAARTAFKRTTLRSVKVTVRLTLSKSGASRATSKAFTLRR